MSTHDNESVHMCTFTITVQHSIRVNTPLVWGCQSVSATITLLLTFPRGVTLKPNKRL